MKHKKAIHHAKVESNHIKAEPIHKKTESILTDHSHDKSYSLAIIAIIAILIIVFIVSSYLQYSADAAGKAYSTVTNPKVQTGKTIIYSGDVSNQYSYMKHQKTTADAAQ